MNASLRRARAIPARALGGGALARAALWLALALALALVLPGAIIYGLLLLSCLVECRQLPWMVADFLPATAAALSMLAILWPLQRAAHSVYWWHRAGDPQIHGWQRCAAWSVMAAVLASAVLCMYLSPWVIDAALPGAKAEIRRFIVASTVDHRAARP